MCLVGRIRTLHAKQKECFFFFLFFFLDKRLHSVLSLTLQLERHSRENGWRMSGVGLTGVCVEFRIGIHYLHSAFTHWSDTRRCKNVIKEVLCLQAKLENDIRLE